MTAKRDDLLSITRAVVIGAQIIVIVLMVIAAVILIGVFNGAEKPLPTFMGTLGKMDPQEAMYALRVGMIGAIAGGALLMPLFRKLLRIIDSTRIGDPFVPENGKHLRHIAWLLLALNVCTSITISVALRGGIKFPPVSLSGALTVLLVFVLARIFQKGSEMRTELKETV